MPVNSAYELSNQFRNTLKPVFKLLWTRINEISEDVESINVSEQLINYTVKSELVKMTKLMLLLTLTKNIMI